MNGIQRVAKDRRYNALASINSVLDLMSKDIQEKDIMTQVNRALEAVRTSTTLETNNYYKDVLSSIDFLLNETLSLLQSFTFATHKNDHDFQKIQTFPVERDIEPGDYSPPVGFSGEIVAPNETFNLSELFFNENVIATLRDSIATSEKLSNLLENLAVLAGKERVALYPPRSFLLYGPPGTGKTSLIRAIAQEAQRPLLSLTASDIFSKWQGESERVVREIFKYIKQNSNCIFFLDEVDALFQKRGSVVESESSRYVKTEFLVRIQDALVRRESYSNFVFIAATNLPWDLDPAFKRRFESMIYVALPDVSSRYKFWLSWVRLFEEDAELNVENNERGVNTNRNCSEVTMSQSNINSLDFLVRITEGYSISDLQSILRNTILVNARELLTHSWFFCNEHGHWLPCSPQHPAALHKNFSDLPKGTVFPSFIKLNNFLETLQQNPPTISKKDLDQYEQWKVSR